MDKQELLARVEHYSGIITQEKPETPLVDVMQGASRWWVSVHDHGYIALVDVMPRLVPKGQTCDYAVVQAARVSYGDGTKKISEDRGLIRYLLRHIHTTPFEMVDLKFHCVMPIFVARQWIRHRTASVNEYSGRYSVMPDRFFKPPLEQVRLQSNKNRQGGETVVDTLTAKEYISYLHNIQTTAYAGYKEMGEKGIARELARIALPSSVYTEWYWEIDLHNLLHFLSLRMEPHAQVEFQEYACAMFAMVRRIAPITCEAYLDYRHNAITLTALEVEAVQTGEPLDTSNRRELDEWEDKRKRLGL